MKKIFVFLALGLLGHTFKADAQIQRGNLLVGGDIANFNLDLDKGGNFNMVIDPKIAFFIRNNLAIGPYVSLGIASQKGNGTSISYGIGGLARYYISDTMLNLIKHGRFFVEGNVGIQGDNPAVGDNTNGLGLGIGPGFAYFITPNIGLETLLKFNGIVGFGSKTTSNNVGLSVGFQIYLPSRKLNDLRSDIKNMR